MPVTSVKKFAKNIAFAFTAQTISLIASILTSMIVPKLLGVEQFSYWQLFIFYSGYVGFFHFGMSDGIYLRYGGQEIGQLNRPLIGSQYRLMFLWQVFICAVLLPFVILTTDSFERKIIWGCIAVYLPIANTCWFWGYVYQAANRIRVYSFSTIISKVTFIVCIVVLLLTRQERFEIYIILFIMSQFAAAIYCIIKSRKFIFSNRIPFKVIVHEAWLNIRVGINLTVSNIASSLILGIGRLFVDITQEITEFGYLSFAISLTNFFLQFISQISMVMFPALRQINPDKAKQLFVSLRRNSGFFLCFFMVLFEPMKWMLSLWLPQYDVSFHYLTCLLPICIFDGKMQLLFSTYLKVLRKERILLCINMISFAFSAGLCAFGTFILESLNAVVIIMVFCVALRSILANTVISGIYGISIDVVTIWECALSVVFIAANMYFSSFAAGCLYFTVYCTYIVANRRYILEILNTVKKMVHRKQA